MGGCSAKTSAQCLGVDLGVGVPRFQRTCPPLDRLTGTSARPPTKHRNALSSKRPRHHQWELSSPQCVTMRRDPFAHHDVRTRIAQRDRPPPRVVEEERLQRAGDEVGARNRTRHRTTRFVTRARRAGEDRTVDVWMPKPKGERELSTRRDTEHRAPFRRQRDSEPRPRPSADFLDEKPYPSGQVHG